MRDAVIVSTARTPIGKAYRGAFNNTSAQTLAAHAIRAAVERAGLDGSEISDCVIGTAIQQGSTGGNIGRQAAIRAGLPVTVAGMSLDRQCASGMMAIATAAKQVITDGMDIVIGGGVESISLVQNDKMRMDWLADAWTKANKPALYMSMLETAEIVADRYGVSREDQDAYALQSQQRTAAGQAGGKFDDEIVPITTKMLVQDKETKAISEREVTLTKDEGNRPSTKLDDLSGLSPVFKGGQTVQEGRFITAGNASQLSDGASAAVVMEKRKKPSVAALRRWGATWASWPQVASQMKWVSARFMPCPNCSRRMALKSKISVFGS
jgi:acetyl-CoA C-acetyltransferase